MHLLARNIGVSAVKKVSIRVCVKVKVSFSMSMSLDESMEVCTIIEKVLYLLLGYHAHSWRIARTTGK